MKVHGKMMALTLHLEYLMEHAECLAVFDENSQKKAKAPTLETGEELFEYSPPRPLQPHVNVCRT